MDLLSKKSKQLKNNRVILLLNDHNMVIATSIIVALGVLSWLIMRSGANDTWRALSIGGYIIILGILSLHKTVSRAIVWQAITTGIYVAGRFDTIYTRIAYIGLSLVLLVLALMNEYKRSQTEDRQTTL